MDKIIVNHQEPLAYSKIASFIKEYINKDTVIICADTDKSIGDSLGPIVENMLKEKSIPLAIYGTLDSPVHALNLQNIIDTIKENHRGNIIGIDASMGNPDLIGSIIVKNEPLYPGKGINKNLPSIGETSISGIVDEVGEQSILNPRSVRLSLVFNMAKIISNAIIEAYNIKIK